MPTKLRSILVLLVIIVSLIPVYLVNRYLQKIIRPRQSMGRLLLYVLCAFLIIFIYTTLVVLLVKKLFVAKQ